MKLNLEINGELQSLDLEGDDLANLILQAMEHVERNHPEISTRPDFPVLLTEAVLNGLACDLSEIDLQLN